MTLTQASHIRSVQSIAPPVNQNVLTREVADIHTDNLILSQGGFDMYLAKADDIPNVMCEIGRLREITFRAVGEGTGKTRDLDVYDEYYWQLFIWDRETQQIIGGYRLGEGKEIFERLGIDGFYLSSLFHIKVAFGKVLQQSIELGRSFIIPEFQKKRLPLFLLWRGILSFLGTNPCYRFLIGPVSVSKYYSDISKSLIIAFVRQRYFDEENAALVAPRKPFEFTVESQEIEARLSTLADMDELENLIETIEPNHIKLPVLLKQYVRQNARFIGFNLDPNFDGALDGLMLLDLQHVRKDTIENLKKSW